MGFWIPLAIFVGTTILGAVFRPRVKAPAAVIGPSPGDLQYPTTDDGPIVVPFGTCFIRQPTVVFEKKIAPVPILDAGVTVGHKYYTGLQLGICHGPIDGLRAVRFNDKPIGASITAANNKIVFGFTPPYATAEIPVGGYGSGAILALAIETAMKAALPGNWKVTHGFTIEAGRNDLLQFIVVASGPGGPDFRYTATIAPGNYTSGSALIAAVVTALNYALANQNLGDEPGDGTFTGNYNVSSPNKFVITYNDGGHVAGYVSWSLIGADDGTFDLARTAMSTLGHYIHATKTCDGANKITSNTDVFVKRLIFSYTATLAKLVATDPAFTAATILGITPGADYFLATYCTTTDLAFITATITDTGDFIQLDINDPNFFGTDGGIQGRVDVYKGLLTQAGSTYLTTEQGLATPPFPGICHAVLRDVYVGNSNYLKPLGFEVIRLPNTLGLDPLIATIGDDANPPAIIWDAAANDRWGLGSTAALDVDSFQAAAQTLYDEGLGVSMAWNQVQPAREYLNDVLRHIDGVVYKDPTSGKRKLKLARADYVVASLPLADEDNVTSVSLRRPSLDELKNVIRIRYLDRGAGYVERVEQVQDLAGIQSRGGVQDVEEIAFLGLSNAANAKKVALRTLLALGYPLASLELTVLRELWALHVGAVFRLTWAPLGLVDVPCRVTNVEGGYLGKDEIHLQAVEDIFGVAS